MFEEVSKKTFPELEEEVLAHWEKNSIFEKSLEARKTAPYFSFYDGPPFATGLPHYGHLLAGTIKDVVPRYKTMKGYYAPRRFGWDCHGIPIEHEIEKKLHLNGSGQIEAFGVANFNNECEAIVQRYVKEWRKIVTRMGRFVDFDQTWKTMDRPFMETVWWVFKQLWEKGDVYEGYRVMPFSTGLGTPLSNFEAGENYQEVDDPALTVAFELQEEKGTYLLAWTTTPWTLLSNLALMVGGETTYVKALQEGRDGFYILAEDRLFAYPHFEVVERFKGSALVGKSYLPLFPYFRHLEAFRVILGEEVSTSEGTGIVHAAPAFGEQDFYACRAAGIPLACPVDQNGIFTAEIPEYHGKFVKSADKEIIKRLKSSGALFEAATVRHRYPFCPRSDTPIIYRATSTWFVKVEQVRERLIAANEKTHWTPHHIKHGRFGKWLAQARDWNIARMRYWGTPIPLWRCGDEVICIGSIAELEELVGEKVGDLHRHHIDPLTIERDGKRYVRIPEVFDCWFESGSMPYAQNHYPFENKEHTDRTHPADFIAEGLDQTRGWFYTLTVLSTLLFDEPAFKNIIVNGIVLAEDGQKMSKRLRNYPPVEEVINKYGADAIRLYLLSSPAVRADDLRFSEKGVELVMRQVLLPLWNAYFFLVTYARIYQWKPKLGPATLPIDRWIVSRLQKLILDVEEGMKDYDLSRAVEPFVGFVDQLTNWYIRLNRRRFWEGEDAFPILYRVLVEVTKIAAPFIPFMSDAIFRALTDKESVHLADFPNYNQEERDEELEQAMEAVQTVTRLGHALRKMHKIRVRQPLQAVHIASNNQELLRILRGQAELIQTELNVHEVALQSDESQFVIRQAKPNFRVLGKKVGKEMRRAQEEIAAFGKEQIAALERGEAVQGEVALYAPEDVEIERKVREGMEALNEGELTVILDTKLTETLEIEGLARELVSRISAMRREADLGYTDRIMLKIDTTERLQQAFHVHRNYITHETLAISVSFEKVEGEQEEIVGERCVIEMTKPNLL
ncbi:MAG: isoleucine--tRNA ligase [Verrucomicrobia bacterium]|nr:isoleucine--tRNA ligase [Verrucomicrobiota bacterium]